ncbi:alpha-ketoglutarate-dependent dioxygenase AlkB family protein [Pararobbsia alpina]|nr:alpha-ketoglutarate-dependent dioxygenase AlkB [Pararobbsia alpina]
MFDLFDDIARPDIDWYPAWLSPDDATALFERLLAEVNWKQDSMRTPAGMVPFPRLTAWQGEPEAIYTYSGVRNIPDPWTPAVAQLRRAAEASSAASFNSVLINRYRTGADSLGWHADKEAVLGREPVIASISLGATRAFQFKHVKSGVLHTLNLSHGSLLVMRGRTQIDWVHRVPKAPKVVAERINLTFRSVSPAA